MITRTIPSTQEQLPIIGMGTWQAFDVGVQQSESSDLKSVLSSFAQSGATLIDSSPMYGKSEEAVGHLTSSLNINDKIFMATKIWTTGKEAGIRQMENSFRMLKREKIDLMQIHNLVDYQTHLKTLRNWKEAGRIRYIGLTHYVDSAHQTLEKIIKEEPVDFIQINYNIVGRNAENSLFKVAGDNQVAIIVNRPFAEKSLFQKIKGKQVPEWCKEFDCTSWSQFLLKFIISQPFVTCVIPATANVHHMEDNLQAGLGRLPNEKEREKMIQHFERL